jgi:3-hydroxyisobutyrate dehydrogenase
MGAGMARSLLRAGLPVTVWNRHADRARPLADHGAAVAESAADAVRDADVVITMLFDERAVSAVMAEAAPAMRDGAVWMQSSTVGREGIAALTVLAREHGLTMVDAPVVGTKQPAEDGTLVVLASGPAAARPTLDPVFDAIGAKTVWLGDEAGAASAMKLVANSWVAVLTAGTAQAVQARAFGLEPATFLEMISGGSSDSAYLQMKGSAMIEDRLAPQFGLDGLLKDLRLIRQATAAAGLPTPVIDALVTVFEQASESGHGHQDIAAVVTSFAPRAAASSL